MNGDGVAVPHEGKDRSHIQMRVLTEPALQDVVQGEWQLIVRRRRIASGEEAPSLTAVDPVDLGLHLSVSFSEDNASQRGCVTLSTPAFPFGH